MAGEKSAPRTTAPRAAAAAAAMPGPQARSSTRVPAPIPAASSRAATKPALAGAKVARYCAAARCQPRCSKSRIVAGSKAMPPAWIHHLGRRRQGRPERRPAGRRSGAVPRPARGTGRRRRSLLKLRAPRREIIRRDGCIGRAERRPSRADRAAPGGGRARRRLRRHRHLAALHDPAMFRRHRLGVADPGLRRAVADRLGPDPGGDGQVRAGADARRQPRRRRHPGADRARAARLDRAAAAGGGVGLAVRRRAVLRRRGADPGDLGAELGRGARGQDPRACPLRAAADDGPADRAVPRPAPRHRAGRRAVRTDHHRLVYRDRAARGGRDRAQPGDPPRPRPALRLRADPRRPQGRLRAARRGGAGGDRGRGAVCRYGHFGRPTISRTWLRFVFPALLLNYFGQGALLLAHPDTVQNPFYRLAPEWAVLPLVVLASAATVIASQAVISGAFSLTHQAVQLGYLPRLQVRHTSEHEIGQVYVPSINALLLVAVAATVLGFRSSDALGSAYGVAVTGTMTVTTVLAFVYLRAGKGWSVWQLAPLFGVFLAVDVSFFAANLLKLAEGGWFPLVIAIALYTTMTAWRWGRDRLAAQRAVGAMPLDMLIAGLDPERPRRVPGTAVYMTARVDNVPAALLHNMKHNKILHERNVLMTVRTMDVPRVPEADRIEIHHFDKNFHTV